MARWTLGVKIAPHLFARRACTGRCKRRKGQLTPIAGPRYSSRIHCENCHNVGGARCRAHLSLSRPSWVAESSEITRVVLSDRLGWLLWAAVVQAAQIRNRHAWLRKRNCQWPKCSPPPARGMGAALLRAARLQPKSRRRLLRRLRTRSLRLLLRRAVRPRLGSRLLSRALPVGRASPR